MTDQKKLSISAWYRSSACNYGNCVEVQFGRASVRVRNSQHPDRTVEFTADEWDAFMRGAHAGEFEPRDLPAGN